MLPLCIGMQRNQASHIKSEKRYNRSFELGIVCQICLFSRSPVPASHALCPMPYAQCPIAHFQSS
ncbi:MAG: hypothetical protein F6J93_25645 [Oscillatoria sp. SIO1A7]|nr:hypothetical protein [Oscillatoria sp. SIO1A7]